MGQRIPDKPADLSSDEWNYIRKRDNYACALAPICQARGVVGFCDDALDVDHEHPRELSGDSTYANMRLLCANTNRGRKVEPSDRWAVPNYWDETPVTVGNLRQIQQLAGWNAIDQLEKDARDTGLELPALRRVLLGTTTLLPGATGIGKTLLFQSIAFRLNLLLGIGMPRIRFVLWLVTDNTLRDLSKKELEIEAYDLDIVPRKPVLQIADSFDNLIKGPDGADIVVCTAQTLWKVEKGDGTLRRSDDKIREALERFDTIVFDEGDWATDEVRHVAGLANHTWQFALTASPRVETLVGEDKADIFRKRFVLISNDAIADYARAVRLDFCLKLLSTSLTKAGNSGRDEFARGLRRTVNSTLISDDLIVLCSLVIEAIIEADHLETRMKQVAPDDYYSPHVMARFDTTKEIELAAPLIEDRLKDLFRTGDLQNPGWNTAMLFAGMRTDRLELRDLSAKDKYGRWRHPFMRAKNTGGKADDSCCRVLLMCNIGVRGINNWPIQTIVDCSKRAGLTDLIQFDFGRAIRWPNHLARWLADPNLSEFATLKIMIPPTRYEPIKKQAIEQARSFIDNMFDEVNDEGFFTWLELLSGRNTKDASVKIAGGTRPITPSEKFKMQGIVADQSTLGGDLNGIPIEDLVTRCFPAQSGAILTKLTDYGTKLLDREFRQREMMASPIFTALKREPICVIDKLIPQENYDLDTLLRWVRSEPLFQKTFNECSERLKAGDQLTIDMVSDRLRRTQQLNYRSPPARYPLNAPNNKEFGVIDDVARELARQLYEAEQEPSDKGIVPAAVRKAACKLFDISTARNGGPMDQPAYHIAILGKYRRTIQGIARALMISNNVWPSLKRFVE